MPAALPALREVALDDKYELDSVRYVAFQREKILRYVADCNSAVEVRLGSYVDPCYVDAGYVSPNSDPVPA